MRALDLVWLSFFVLLVGQTRPPAAARHSEMLPRSSAVPRMSFQRLSLAKSGCHEPARRTVVTNDRIARQ